jgi:hypothetical protein
VAGTRNNAEKKVTTASRRANRVLSTPDIVSLPVASSRRR